MGEISAQRLIEACSDMSIDTGLRFSIDLEPVGGPGAPVKPAIYEGGRYQTDRRWASPSDEAATDVVVIDNVPSQANRLEATLKAFRDVAGLPEFRLDLSGAGSMPAHLPRSISSLQFPHRNADAYLRDAQLDGVDFGKTALGKSILDATPWSAGALMAWFPQSLLFGFWQSHLGSKKAQTKHARAWNSEILGWKPATTGVRVMGLKGDPLNLNTKDEVTSNTSDRSDWVFGKGSVEGGSKDKLSEMGHGQIPFMSDDEKLAPAGISFARLSQLATVSFAQLRRVGLGASGEADATARALLVALGVFAHVHAFGRAFALRSGADLIPVSQRLEWLGSDGTEVVMPSREAASALLAGCVDAARSAGVPLDGWGREPQRLTPKDNLLKAIRATWPQEDD